MSWRGVGDEELRKEVGPTEGGQPVQVSVSAGKVRVRIVPRLVVVVLHVQGSQL